MVSPGMAAAVTDLGKEPSTAPSSPTPPTLALTSRETLAHRIGTTQAFMGIWSPAMSLAQTVPRNVILPHMPVGCIRHDAKLRGLASSLL